MTRDEALASGLASLFVLPAVAAQLIQTATEGESEELRVRARDALLRLDVDSLTWCPSAGRLVAAFEDSRATAQTDAFAAAVSALVARAVRSASREERQRIAPLLQRILREAERLAADERRAA